MLAALAGPWGWIIAGLVLMAIELLAPGLFFIWFGLAALLVGLITAFVGLSWQASWLLFAVLSVASAVLVRRLTRKATLEPDAADALNVPARQYIGRVVRLDEPIVDGRGRVRMADTVWMAHGPDIEAGAEVRVVGVKGTALVVERA